MSGIHVGFCFLNNPLVWSTDFMLTQAYQVQVQGIPVCCYTW